ncbi:hypothetical protein PHJA_001765400 [Phtheirospermum japonicum]|uniref:Heparan-alpha-glucosaminide N-acetyltransferase n=1 Tax=Phtheirospermum japonicum TaxID=374723 RepID=A0A830CK83_9LAMI|nr:hypothetical protein PHJA_001765400 [Phtheirospermum japonicum]
MILVDDAGKGFPSINHAPWFEVTLADFVMPFLLFGVGVSVSLVFKNVANKLAATKKVVIRYIKLFLLGIILQGGYVHGRDNLTYGVDIMRIRVIGVLQRIEIGSLYMVLLFGLYVPSWALDESDLCMILPTSLGANRKTVHCGLRGNLKPPCNAVRLIDRVVLGEKHLYQHPVYIRTKCRSEGMEAECAAKVIASELLKAEETVKELSQSEMRESNVEDLKSKLIGPTEFYS